MKKTYDLYISLGAACSCTTTIRKCNLQFFSYPYDWVANVSYLDRVKFLTNDFQGWFNKEDLKFSETVDYIKKNI